MRREALLGNNFKDSFFIDVAQGLMKQGHQRILHSMLTANPCQSTTSKILDLLM
jgi:hypothetical protein